MNPLLLADFYKTIHHNCYKPGLEKLVSYWTPRMSRIENIDKVVIFGLQGFIKKYLIDYFNDNFFSKSKDEIISEYKRIIGNTMGAAYTDTYHIEKLHDIGYLPIEIKAVDEGTRIPIKVPAIQITNTHKDFPWLVNYLETLISCNIWTPMTSASIAYRYREIINEYFEKTVENGNPRKAAGDFSMRGMTSPESAEISSAGHLLSFDGTATIPSINWLEKYYNANCNNEIVGLGTPSTEHSVMSSWGKDDELNCYKYLINKQFPDGPISIVSDTYDYWNVVTNYLNILKDDIMARNGKVIIRGDSGDPVDIICGEDKFIRAENKEKLEYFCKMKNGFGDHRYYGQTMDDGKYYIIDCDEYGVDFIDYQPTAAEKGTVECLWEIFGGTINSKGYKVLDPHIGTIYGDGITLQRCADIYRRLEAKGFAVNNCTLGIGSFTYQYNTRDTFGFALKATHSIVDGKEMHIFKDPATDKDKFKKSQRGMCIVYKNEQDEIVYKDQLSIAEAEADKENLLTTVFKDGKIVKDDSLKDIKIRLHGDF